MKGYFMKEKKKINQVITIIFITFLIGIVILNIITKDIEISIAERRKLKTFPKFEVELLIDGSFMAEFEKYALDQFPFRETFRKIKGNLDFFVFHKKDVNDIFVYKNHLIKLEYSYNPKSIEHFNTYIKQISDKYLRQSNVYLSIIPDKGFFVQGSEYPTLDYGALEESVRLNLENISYINLFEQLSLEDYYYTDTHWKQENLLNIVDCLEEAMGFDSNSSLEDYVAETFNNFKGVYYSQSALQVPKDDLKYLFKEEMKNVIVKNYENLDSENASIYDLDQLEGLDPYNVFLSGGSPLIEIENLNNTRGKELIIFRDSFASSLSPLLLEGYSKITLIDTRYMSYMYLGEYVDFVGKDVLFLYNTTVINNSQMLK